MFISALKKALTSTQRTGGARITKNEQLSREASSSIYTRARPNYIQWAKPMI